ncbi:MAG: GrrA/OscA1 family cyclophane-containing rSAM-modified RiPP [Synechococcaceae cyanobacterium]|nr:GrrA/OscA1 family cyclophane-containing rSAM-modified RiPP [Synechococcaceae cyanobacterium]
MAFLSRSRLFGLLLIMASLPLDPGIALALSSGATPSSPHPSSGSPAAEAMEARLQRIAAAVREKQAAGDSSVAVPDNAVAWVGWGNGGGRAGWGNGGFRNGGFRNGGWGNGFRNGGWGNGGGGWRNFRNW